ncbi:Gfo/Idh/MocA family oxidoreductase [Phycicoccus sp. CSK15P-2]|uniref:Gfo/Idh/MocA family protein n=1 Tax=Phycicoccus sp. CSK15P-2 TaxID=2807627 RepID=UPI00194F839F|nr:Gfo/Idh/MocA family oxidoreductase [Phycicoccus sp. CSK15P-2]MBM6406028.1 Gfo/Idh/MocA family oxidoreductase [Phycicoccus sp. CSK15P-2]
MRIGLAGVGRIGAFHAATLSALPAVDTVVATDADPVLTEKVATELGLETAPDAATLLDSGIDGVVIATATPGHAPLLRAALEAGVPVFCEKPVAATLAETIELAHLAESTDVPVHVGFQRRFDPGHRRAREAVAAGELGTVHAVRSQTHDQAPPHAAYIPTSGGIFRDCAVHDVDGIRFVTGREVVTVYATGENVGAPFFREAGDVDTAVAVLTLDDGTLATVTATRYSGTGYDVRMEVMGEHAVLGVGFDDSLALVSAEPGADFPRGTPHLVFMDRFRTAYTAELAAFCEVAAGHLASPCTVRDALEAFRVAEACELSRAERRPVDMAEIATVEG